MFHSGSPSPYSSFFMSGFQHASHSAPSSSISPSFPIDQDDWFIPDFRRRGSLPTDESASLEKQLSVKKPTSTRERSWLSLDLARQRKSMPSPKPVPSMRLPAVPEGTLSPTPSSVLLPVPSPPPARVSFFPLSPPPTARFSFLPLSPPPTTARVSFLPLSPPPTARVSPPPQKPASAIARSNSTLTKKSSSTVSTRYRRARRTDALARLEGKASHWEDIFSWCPAPLRKNSIKRSFNFMSMSDDEADSDMEDSFFDIGFDFSSSDSHHRSHSSPDVPISPTDTSASVWVSSPLARVPTHKRRRSKTLSQLLPGLTSFIDLDKEKTKRDSKRWRGRSFIEIASL